MVKKSKKDKKAGSTPPDKTGSELDRFGQVIGVLPIVFPDFLKWPAICFLGYWAAQVVIAGVGQETSFTIILSGLLEDVVDKWTCSVWAGVALLSVLYGLRQRRLRGNTISDLTPRIKALETALDRERSSSELGARGETRTEDM